MSERRRYYGSGMGRAVPAASASALTAPSPRQGEVRRTALPDTFDGIRFEIGRMVKYVQDARKDPLMIETARQICGSYGAFVEEMSRREGNPISAHNNKTLYVEAIDLWCREYFCYVNDPPNIEVIQTAPRMIRQTRIPREIIEHLMDPFFKAMERTDPKFDRSSYTPPPMFIGDCDEGCVAFCGLCACMEIAPIRFRFGGNDGTLHHVWSRVQADGTWYDSDLTEPGFKLGQHSRFQAYEEVEIPL